MGEVTMFYRTILMCLVGSISVELVKTDSLNIREIVFKIEFEKDENNVDKLICDHNDNRKKSNKYTVLEGEKFKIKWEYNNFINEVIFGDYYNTIPFDNKEKIKNVTTFIAEKKMGTLWNCTMLTNRDVPVEPVVWYHDGKETHSYSAVYCYMQIHVRQTKPPQMILVNNMALQAVRKNLSEKHVDFIAEYQYVDGDVVNVACVNFLGTASLTMEYPMADTLSDMFTSRDLSSSQAIGFATTLHSTHNNSCMICTAMEESDYTKVMVRFVVQTKPNIVNIKINGMTLRPKLFNENNHKYQIAYKYESNQPIKVVCEVKQTDMRLVVTDSLTGYVGKEKSYKKRELIPSNKTAMSFHLSAEDKSLTCSADNVDGKSAESIDIKFSKTNFPVNLYPLHMELPPKGTVMELYDYGDDKTRNVIFYEFEDDEKLLLQCGPLHQNQPGPVLYLKFKDSKCFNSSCNVTQSLTVTEQHDNSELVCDLIEPHPDYEDKVLKEIKVILRKRVLTTTTTTTTTPTPNPTTTTVQPTDVQPASSVPQSSDNPTDEKGKPDLTKAVIVGAVVCIIIICVSIVIIKLRKRNQSQGGPNDRNYENLATPSETSIPAFPPQWESNYAVPVDRRTDDTTYSVPCEPALYSTPIPKNLRNKNQKPDEPTYAVLNMPTTQGRKNVFKETDDPNYSEVYADRQDECYAKVLPKSVRNKTGQDRNPYSYVTNDSSYANTGVAEPMYCEPAIAAAGQYANVNNSPYVNSSAQEYVEPTYCEPQKRKK